jgi:NTE family protein
MKKKKLTDPSDLRPSDSQTNGNPAGESYNSIENVLVLQGGGSLGAFGCGVFKAIANHNIKLDIIAGTSIGGINAAIIAGSKDEKHPEKSLERFWLELSESFVDLDQIVSPPQNSMPEFVENWLQLTSAYMYNGNTITSAPASGKNNDLSSIHPEHYDMKMRQFRSFYSSAIFGIDKMFRPRWAKETALSDPEFFTPQNWTYIYDHTPLVKTLENYIDYEKLRPNGNPHSRLILTAVNILNAEPQTFDSSKEQITPKHILATSAYPLYNFRWVEIEKGIYSWDGSLLSNTPLREVIDASPINDKRIFIVENYPKKVELLPKNLPEVHHRARDIMFSDKTEHNIAMSKVITMYLKYIDELYQIIEDHVDLSKMNQDQLKTIRNKYKKIKRERGAEIKDILYITRDELFPHIYENADFSPQTIKASIKEGELKTAKLLDRRPGAGSAKRIN